MKKGIIQIYTGEGKGKTTAAFGQALRAAGRGLHVIVLQFLKNRDSGEVLAIKKFLPLIEVRHCNSQQKFSWKMDSAEQKRLKQETISGWRMAYRIIENKECDLLILDEISYPLKYNLLEISEVIEVLAGKPPELEVILTGREMPEELCLLAQLITEMKKIKHPFDQGLPLREGIEY